MPPSPSGIVGSSKTIFEQEFLPYVKRRSRAKGGVILVVGAGGSGRKTLARAIAAHLAPDDAGQWLDPQPSTPRAALPDPKMRWLNDSRLIEGFKPLIRSVSPERLQELGLQCGEAIENQRPIPILFAPGWEQDTTSGLQRISRWASVLTSNNPGVWFISTLSTEGGETFQIEHSLQHAAGAESNSPLLVLRTLGYWERDTIDAFLHAQLGIKEPPRRLGDALWQASGEGGTRIPGIVASLLKRWQDTGVVVRKNQRWMLSKSGGLLGRLRKRQAGPSWSELIQQIFTPFNADEVRVLVLAACGGDCIPATVLGAVVGQEALETTVEQLTVTEGGMSLWRLHEDQLNWREPVVRETLSRLAHAQFIWSLQAERDCRAAIEYLKQQDIQERARWAQTESAWRERIRMAPKSVVEALPQTGDAELLAFLTWLRWGPGFEKAQLQGVILRLDAMFRKMGNAIAGELLWQVGLERDALPQGMSREMALIRLGDNLLAQGRAAQAESILRRAIHEMEQQADSDTQSSGVKDDELCEAHLRLVEALLGQGHAAEGERHCRQLLNTLNVAGLSALMVAEIHHLLGCAVLENERPDDAEGLLADALQAKILAKAPVLSIAETREALGRALFEQDRPTEAKPIFARVLWDKIRSGGLPHSVAITRYHLAETLAQLELFDEASEKAEDAMAVLTTSHQALADACAHPHQLQRSTDRLLRNLCLM